MLKLKLQYFCHLMWTTDSLEKTLMLVFEDWRQKKRTTEDEMVGWHHRLDGHEAEQAPGVGNGQGNLVCFSLWDRKYSYMTEQLNWLKLNTLLSSGYTKNTNNEHKMFQESIRKLFHHYDQLMITSRLNFSLITNIYKIVGTKLSTWPLMPQILNCSWKKWGCLWTLLIGGGLVLYKVPSASYKLPSCSSDFQNKYLTFHDH